MGHTRVEAELHRFQKALASHLQQLRAEAELSQRATAAKAGMKQQQYFRLENGTTNPTVETLVRVAHAFDLDLAGLLAFLNRGANK
jgi:transcriptional regulator with XRE-family HTH domain